MQKRGEQEGRGQTKLLEQLIRFPLASKWAPIYLPINVGIRLSESGTHRRVSSRVDQITCRTPLPWRLWPWLPAYSFSANAPRKRDAKRPPAKTLHCPAKTHIGGHDFRAEPDPLFWPCPNGHLWSMRAP